MKISHGMWAGFTTVLLLLPVTTVLAAEGEENQDLNQVVEQLQAENPGLTETEALEIAGLAAADAQVAPVREGSSPALAEGAGVTALGAPDVGLGGLGQGERAFKGIGPGGALTAREQKLMNEMSTFQQDLAQKGLGAEQIHNQIEAKFGEQLRQEGIEQGVFTPGERDDFQLRELYNQGVPVDGALEQRGGFEHGGPAAMGLESGTFESGREFGQSVAEGARTMERGSFSEGIGREGAQGMERGGSSEGIGREGAGGTSREQAERSYQPMERDSNAQGGEHGQRETEHRGGGSEREQQSIERPTYDREHSAVERPTYEREQPTMERPTYEREQPTMEREQPTMERPTMEHPAYEVK